MSPPPILDELRAAVGAEHVLTDPVALRTYDCDGLTGWRATPIAVVLPATAAEVQEAVRACVRHSIPFVARGAGTGLSGGALPIAEGIVISVARMNRILEVDLESHRVIVEPGVANLDVTRAVADHGYLLRTGSVEPAGVHDRRQRCRELRWRALPQERVHGQPRHGRDVRAAGRRASRARRHVARQ